ncbi:murein transglycosylase [Exophiala aquamarina CBS 119918]|uniref:Murein transglycosylase n=1 Tax=Exophiala aquamarina CBS 119918 TaxID=1182545 RepID=A0A072PK59_9EURO|nr:murein transglycosylase [Exophiala aquamarina CBS 119918]KEF60494.1 murein transglycosylase [Exophiala aquamarina CBS 119918]
MRKRTITSSASALLLLLASLVSAKHATHEHLNALHKRHRASRELGVRSTSEDGDMGVEIRAISETTAPKVEKRGGQCAFPYDAGLVPVTPGQQNAGWAMSPDQPPKPGSYMPYACPPGQVSMQWDPSATSYSYPKSMNGGLYCDENGNVEKPFPNKPYCQATSNNIGVTNKAGGVVSFCQTVLPGNEAMLIPTAVYDTASLAVPDPSYWCSTAAHYYINPPGVGPDDACVWGSTAKAVGNWSPYVAGANVDASGQTFIKLGWNPIYLEPTTPFRDEVPNWGVKIECANGGCSGLPCGIDPSQNQVNQMLGSASNGAGGGAFCVVTVAKGSSANFVVFNTGGDSGSGSSSSSGNGNHGGQFYASSTTSAPSSSAPSTTSDVTTSTEPTTIWSSRPSSSSHPWGGWDNDTSTAYTSSWAPRPSQYYSLFDYSTAATATETAVQTESSQAQPTAAASSTTGPQPSIKTATGAASLAQASLWSLLSGVTLCVLLST